MVLTRSQSFKAKSQNINLTKEDYDCARTLMQLRSATNSRPVSPISDVNVKINVPHDYNLRNRITSSNYSIHDDWDTLNDPTWVPWNKRNVH